MELISAITTVSMLTHLANVMHCEGRGSGLSSAQSNALLYFANANRLSRTVSAFAKFHATTRGTASQTIKSLVERDLLVRMKSGAAGQRAYVNVTDKGRSLWNKHDALGLVRLVAGLQNHQGAALADILTSILQSIASEREMHIFGPCVGCDYFKQGWSPESPESGDFCKYAKAPLASSETESICMYFKPNLFRERQD